MQIIHNPRLGQRILAIFVCLVTAVLAVMPSVSVSFQSLVSDTVSYIPGTVLEVVEEDLSPSDLKGGPQLGEQTLTIELKDGSQITALRYPDVSVEERDGRTILTVDGAETDITDALSEDGRYVWEDTDNGSQAQVIVTLDEDGKPVWVANVAAAGETFEEAGVSVVSEPADGRPDSSAD